MLYIEYEGDIDKQKQDVRIIFVRDGVTEEVGAAQEERIDRRKGHMLSDREEARNRQIPR